MFEEFDKVQRKIGQVEKAFCTLMMAFIVAINIYGISSRYLFNKPVIYVQELTILGGAWLFFIGIGLVFKLQLDITVEVLVKLFPHRLRLVNDLVVDLLILLFAVIVAWETGRFIPFLHGQGESHAMSFALELPDEIFFFPIGFGAISIFLTLLHGFIGRLANFSSRWNEAMKGSEGER